MSATTTPANEGAWQRQCTASLLEVINSGLPLDEAGAKWDGIRKELASQQRIVIADCDLSHKDLSGYDFRFCYITRVNFERAILDSTEFLQAILRDCNFTSASIAGANFNKADVATSDWKNVKWDARTVLTLSNQFILIKNLGASMEDDIKRQAYIADAMNRHDAHAWRIWNR